VENQRVASIVDDPEYRHPSFLVHSRGRKPSPETVYFALLLRAQKEGTLPQEAEILKITIGLAEAQIRRFQLIPVKRQQKVVELIEKCISDLDGARKVAAEYRFTITSIVR
jgi:hypothetical protein